MKEEKIVEWDKDGNPVLYWLGRRVVVDMKTLKKCIEDYAEAQNILFGDLK